LAFFAWTGLEAYFFYRALVTVFDTNRLSAVLHYTVGYAAPFVIVMTTLTVGIASADEAYIKVQDGEIAACFLHSTYVLALVVPASLVLLLNLGVTITAVYIAHRAGGRRGTSSRGRVFATLRNTLLLSLLLGLTWILALPGASIPVQWINTVLNCSQGFYILLYSVLANRAIRGQVRERITEVASTYMPTYLEKKSEVVDNDGNATKVTVVKSVGSDESIDSKSEKETEQLDETDDLKKRYV